ncbi:MAG: hypothetical protein RLZZ45_943 [Bacteroidota bacterium]|jgi:pectate lyase
MAPIAILNFFIMRLNYLFLFLWLSLGVIAQPEKVISFPGAEGFGKYTIGGRGGKLFIVDNLNDQGPGSFRQAATAKEKRVIVFSVAGTIHLSSPLEIQGNVTIAGQSAPGDGICIADQPVRLKGDQIILRYLRFRMGDKFQSQKGKVDGSGSDDALSGTRNKNLIIDHCSLSWSTDEVMSIYGGDSTTLQWNLIAEPLNYSYHFEEGDKDWENHGYGGIWGGAHLSAHHNLFAHCVSRNPRFNGARMGSAEELVDFRNNVVYNWQNKAIYGGEGGRYNVVGNYFKTGPDTKPNSRNNFLDPSTTAALGYGKWYVSDNFLEGNVEINRDNMKGVTTLAGEVYISSPHESIALPAISPMDAYRNVVRSVGASYERDEFDKRIIMEMKMAKGRIIDVQGGFPHGTPYEKTISAWPKLNAAPSKADTDKDGIPDEWEISNGTNHQQFDSHQFKLQQGYTNIEVYLNSLIK